MKGIYNKLVQTLTAGATSNLGVDVNANLKVTEAGYTPVNLSSSGQILSGPGKIIGFYVNSISGGSFRVSDALTATTPYLGAASVPAAVGYQNYPAKLATGGYVTISGTIDITFFVKID